jgi:hypothetical protein
MFESQLDASEERRNSSEERRKQTARELQSLRAALRAVRGSLTYQAGRAITANFRSPIGWVRMPFALASVGLRYKQNKKKGLAAASATPAATIEASHRDWRAD